MTTNNLFTWHGCFKACANMLCFPVSDDLPDDPETLKAMLLAERHESERLRQIIKDL